MITTEGCPKGGAHLSALDLSSALTFSHAIEDFYFGLSSSQNFHVNGVRSHRLNN